MKQHYTKVFLCLFLPLMAIPLWGQKVSTLFQSKASDRTSGMSDYTLTTFDEAYSDLVGASSVNNDEIWDDPEYVIPIAFPFVLNGTSITYLQLWGVGSLLRHETIDPLVDTYVFPFEADLIDRGYNGANSLSPISYLVEGDPGTQIQKIEWKNAGSYDEMVAFGTLDMFIDFQMWLYEGSNRIEFRYGPSSIDVPEVFYNFNSGPGVGMTEYNETDDIISRVHILSGPADNPFLSQNLDFITGTPAVGMVYQLNVILPLEVAVTGENSTSACEPNGSAMAVATGGVEPYTYAWDNGGTESTITGLGAGVYEVTVEDAEGNTATGSITIEGPDPIWPNASSTDETNIGANDGTATASPTGGTPPYTYLWNTGDTDPTIVDLAPGVYTVTVTDDAGCTAEESVTVNPANCPELDVQLLITPPTCYGSCDGSILVMEVNNGVPPYTYEWSNGGMEALIEDLCSDLYTVLITDANDCLLIATIDLAQPDTLQANAGSTDETLIGNNDGTAWAAPSGGTSPYSYEWSNGSTDSLIMDLTPGIYTVTVTDILTCTVVQDVEVGEGDCALLTAEILHNLCFGDCDGTILVTYINGVDPITYTWSNGQDSAFIDQLCAGDYTVTAVDGTGCEVIATYTVLQSDQVMANAGSTDETIAGDDGTAWAAPSGGIPPYSYEWITGSTDSLITNLPADVYWVIVTDAVGCADTQFVLVNEFVCVIAAIDSFRYVTCHGLCDGEIWTTVEGGIGPFSYMWSNGDTTSNATMVCAGLYSVTITDEGQGCEAYQEFEMSEPFPLTVTVDTIIHLTDTTSTLIQITVDGGSPPYFFSWTGPNGFTSTDEDLADVEPGLYVLDLTDILGCTLTIDTIEVRDETVSTINVNGFHIRVYPNPVSERLVLDYDLALPLTARLFSAHGQEAGQWKNAKWIDVRYFMPGVYWLQLTSGDQSAVLPIAIMR